MGNFRDNRGGGGGRNFGPRRDFNDRGPRQMFQATCASCGKECQVPFRPSGERPVYCSDCFEKQQGNEPRRSFGSDRGPSRPPFRRDDRPQGPSKQELDVVNQKLDQILDLLKPTVYTKEAPAEKAQAEPVEKKKRVSKKKVEAPVVVEIQPEVVAQNPSETTEPPTE